MSRGIALKITFSWAYFHGNGHSVFFFPSPLIAFLCTLLISSLDCHFSNLRKQKSNAFYTNAVQECLRPSPWLALPLARGRRWPQILPASGNTPFHFASPAHYPLTHTYTLLHTHSLNIVSLYPFGWHTWEHGPLQIKHLWCSAWHSKPTCPSTISTIYSQPASFLPALIHLLFFNLRGLPAASLTFYSFHCCVPFFIPFPLPLSSQHNQFLTTFQAH